MPIDFNAVREADFLSGTWLEELDNDYKAHAGIEKKYWQEMYAALLYLWNPANFNAFVTQVENQWKTGNPGPAYIKIPAGYKYQSHSYGDHGVLLHVQYTCPSYKGGWGDPGFTGAAEYKTNVINFNDPQKKYLNPLKDSIKAMHLDLYNAYRAAKNTKKPEVLIHLFNAPSYGCINEKFRNIEFFMLNIAKGLPFDQIVQMILTDYTKFVCTANNWPVMDYNALAVKDGGKYFYFEDIVEYAKKYHGATKSSDHKTVNLHFEATLDAWSLADKRPVKSAAEIAAEQQAQAAAAAAAAQAAQAAAEAKAKALAEAREAREHSYKCFITLNNMTNPVTTECGHNFEKAPLDLWIAQLKNKHTQKINSGDAPFGSAAVLTCPACNQAGLKYHLNPKLKAEINLFLQGGHEAVEAKQAADAAAAANATFNPVAAAANAFMPAFNVAQNAFGAFFPGMPAAAPAFAPQAAPAPAFAPQAAPAPAFEPQAGPAFVPAQQLTVQQKQQAEAVAKVAADTAAAIKSSLKLTLMGKKAG